MRSSINLLGIKDTNNCCESFDVRCCVLNAGFRATGFDDAVDRPLFIVRCCLVRRKAVFRQPNGRPTGARFIAAGLGVAIMLPNDRIGPPSSRLKCKKLSQQRRAVIGHGPVFSPTHPNVAGLATLLSSSTFLGTTGEQRQLRQNVQSTGLLGAQVIESSQWPLDESLSHLRQAIWHNTAQR